MFCAQTAFIEAVSSGNVAAVKEWVKRKEIDVNGLTRENKGPALTTMLRDHYTNGSEVQTEIALLLIDAGARADLLSPRGLTALHYDVSLPILQIFLSARPDVNVRDTRHRTPLLLSAGNGRTERCRLLISARARVNVAADDPADYSPLLMAVEFAHAQTVALLLEAGADIGVQQAIEDSVDGDSTTDVSIALELDKEPRSERKECLQVLQQHWQKLFAAIADVGSPRPLLPTVLVKVVMSYVCVSLFDSTASASVVS